MANEWNEAAVTPPRDGLYEVCVMSSDRTPAGKSAINVCEWRHGAWWLCADGGRLERLTDECAWREKRAGRAC